MVQHYDPTPRLKSFESRLFRILGTAVSDSLPIVPHLNNQKMTEVQANLDTKMTADLGMAMRGMLYGQTEMNKQMEKGNKLKVGK